MNILTWDQDEKRFAPGTRKGNEPISVNYNGFNYNAMFPDCYDGPGSLYGIGNSPADAVADLLANKEQRHPN